MNNFGSVVALFQGGSGDPRTAAERLGDLLEWYGAVGDLASGNPRGFATRKASLAHALARTAERPDDECHAVALAGVLHAVGALENPGLRKGEALPERLARMERWDIPAQGARLCARIAALPHAVADLVRWQAERWDGTGYPDQLLWHNIPFAAHLLAIADAALRCESLDDALTTITEQSGRAFAPEAAMLFLRWYHLAGGEEEPFEFPFTALRAEATDPEELLWEIAGRVDAHNGVPGRTRRIATLVEQTMRALPARDEETAAALLAAACHGTGELAAEEVEDARFDPLARLGIDERVRNGRRAADLADLVPSLRPAVPILRSRAEWFDGTGKPRGLAREAIPLGARVLSVAIAYEGLEAMRHRPASEAEQRPLERLQEAAGTQFDPEVVRAFTRAVRTPV